MLVLRMAALWFEILDHDADSAASFSLFQLNKRL